MIDNRNKSNVFLARVNRNEGYFKVRNSFTLVLQYEVGGSLCKFHVGDVHFDGVRLGGVDGFVALLAAAQGDGAQGRGAVFLHVCVDVTHARSLRAVPTGDLIARIVSASPQREVVKLQYHLVKKRFISLSGSARRKMIWLGKQ